MKLHVTCKLESLECYGTRKRREGTPWCELGGISVAMAMRFWIWWVGFAQGIVLKGRGSVIGGVGEENKG